MHLLTRKEQKKYQEIVMATLWHFVKVNRNDHKRYFISQNNQSSQGKQLNHQGNINKRCNIKNILALTNKRVIF